MRVIILVSSNRISGGIRQALYLAEGLRALGHSVHVVCPPNGELNRVLEAAKFPQTALPTTFFAAEKALRALMPDGEPVLVHAFLNRAVKLAAYFGTYWRLLRLPVACVAHRGVTSRPGNPLPYLLPGIRTYLVNSRACADTLPLLWRKKRCHVVNNSIPEERITPTRSKQDVLRELDIAEDCKIVGSVCNDNPLKGGEQAIRAFALARASMPPSKLVLVGVTPKKWLPLCAELGIADEARLVPRTLHVADYIQIMDLFVFPSMFIESQPNVIIEAMSMGVPAISGDVGGIRELLPPECLFDPKNTREISAKMIQLLQNPDELKRLGAINAAQKSRFSPENRLNTVLRHYQEALDEVLG